MEQPFSDIAVEQPAEAPSRAARVLAIGVPRKAILLKPAEASDVLGVCEYALTRDRSRGKGPPYVLLRNRIRYPLGGLLAWIESKTVTPEPRLRLRRYGT